MYHKYYNARVNEDESARMIFGYSPVRAIGVARALQNDRIYLTLGITRYTYSCAAFVPVDSKISQLQ
jgi:hypothetical protein